MRLLPSLFFAIVLLFITKNTFGQSPTDTTSLVPIKINAYFNEQPLLGVTSSAQVIGKKEIESQNTNTLLPAMNQVSGIRMEERSPGSYRIAMRGSLIRSPFGIRNTKIYIDDFPMTDAGGNTYLNLIDPASIQAIQILKGPDGSLYGSNSGGIIQITPNGLGKTNDYTQLLLAGGSYGLFQEQLSIQKNINDKYSFSLDQSFTRSDGYRENTALNKKTFQTAHQWHYSSKSSLSAFLLYSNLGYRTPGGLTQAQMDENRRQARPAGGPNPGASEQKAGIYNKTIYGGVKHQTQLSRKLSHTMTIFGSKTDFENPFITNYEFRDEENLGIRTYFSFENNDRPNFQWHMQLGFEGQKGWSSIDNYDNHKGVIGNAQAKDNLDNNNSSVFYRLMTRINTRLTLEGSIGLNTATVKYKQRYPIIEDSQGKIDFGSIWMPRIASSYLINDNWAWRASISKGYSSPTLAEVRSSDNLINHDLQAEKGTNYEIGVRWNTKNRRLIADIGAYNYAMKNGIIRQLRDNGAEYYVNAGAMKQKGVELDLWAHLLQPKKHGFLRAVSLHSSLSYNYYRFSDYISKDGDYTNNKMTAVPDWVWTNNFSIDLTHDFSLNISHNHTSSMPLNDANTVYAKGYNLLQLKASWNTNFIKKSKLQFFMGVDNLLNEKYSLGNDINAFGNRFFNPAPLRNYYAGLKVVL